MDGSFISIQPSTLHNQLSTPNAFRTLHDDNPGYFLEVLRRTSATLRRRNITQMANRFEGPSQDGRSLQLMEACYRFSSGHYAFFIWRMIACAGNQKWNFPQFSIKPRGFGRDSV